MFVSCPASARSELLNRAQTAAPPAASAATRPRRPSARTARLALARPWLGTDCSFMTSFPSIGCAPTYPKVAPARSPSVVDPQRDQSLRGLAVRNRDRLAAVAVLARVLAGDARVALHDEGPGRAV